MPQHHDVTRDSGLATDSRARHRFRRTQQLWTTKSNRSKRHAPATNRYVLDEMNIILSQFHGEKIYSCWISQRCEIVRPALTGPSSLRAWWKHKSSERQYFRAFASIVYPPYSRSHGFRLSPLFRSHSYCIRVAFTVHFLTCWIDDVH